MTKNFQFDNDDLAAFRDAMRTVKPLAPNNQIDPIRKNSAPIRRRKKTPLEEECILSDYDKYEALKSEEVVQFNHPGLQHKTLRNLRNGQYTMQSILDLHGMTVQEAMLALQRFVSRCKASGLKYVLIIHGKGRENSEPILKNKLNHWLRELPTVLAFCSALKKDGGTGAMYVLLKNIAKGSKF